MILRRLTIALLGLGLLSGCAAGSNAVTIKPYTPTDGNQVQTGTIKVRNFLVVVQADGSATVIGTAVNSAVESDVITSISVNGQAVSLTPQPLVLNQNAPIIFGGESGNATANVPALGAVAGQLVPVMMTFEKSASVQFSSVVRSATGEFAGLAATPTPSPTNS